MKIRMKITHTPELGECRIIKKFAWLPVKISEEKKCWVWLEKYEAHQRYIFSAINDIFSEKRKYKWTTVKTAAIYQYYKRLSLANNDYFIRISKQ